MTSVAPCPRRLTWGVPLVLPLLALPAAPAGAQVEPTARIVGILDVLDLEERRALPGPTRRVLVQRSDSDDWLDGRDELDLFWADQVLVEPRTLVRLDLSAGEARGRAHLSADLQADDGALVLEEIGGNDQALYEILEVPRELGDLALTVARGSLALDWARGRLALFAAGIRTVVSGTRLLLSVSADGQTGALYLVEGSVSFPDFPAVTLGAGQMALLRAGFPPVVQAPGGAQASRLGDTAEWAADDAWPRPFYRQPWVMYGGAAALAVGGLLLLTGDDYDPGDIRIDGGSRSGVVILRIPF